MSKSVNKNKSALSVKKGVEKVKKPERKFLSKFRLSEKRIQTTEDFVKGILNSDFSILSQAVTLVESTKKEHRKQAQELINACIPHSGKSVRVGITGVPGVGKSTFIEALGMHLIKKGNRIAVLAIDPSGMHTGGSILGDKTRMLELSANKNAFIRPSPSGGTLGGVARKTAEAIVLCEAAGYNIVFIETVGVGQSEIVVDSMVDFFLLLMLAGAGDELQGIKRGITEAADAIVIHKADGNNILQSKSAQAEYKNALHLFPASESGWNPVVQTASSYTGEGISEVWETIEQFVGHTKKNGFFERQRNRQAKFRMYETINEEIKIRFYNNTKVKTQAEQLEKDVLSGKISPYYAAQILLNIK